MVENLEELMDSMEEDDKEEISKSTSTYPHPPPGPPVRHTMGESPKTGPTGCYLLPGPSSVLQYSIYSHASRFSQSRCLSL
ncbi:hypothetical protein BSL78_11939 [Apostichopus japonicus]|uniref:Uncharacterized protein n=1 Tax=Stichopus japonicus TaxID=307972 RepID=A0A2G8KT90_STIJA|nr:hypothetical protein BSL78_11939 [Apostichopus japonicus]